MLRFIICGLMIWLLPVFLTAPCCFGVIIDDDASSDRPPPAPKEPKKNESREKRDSLQNNDNLIAIGSTESILEMGKKVKDLVDRTGTTLMFTMEEVLLGNDLTRYFDMDFQYGLLLTRPAYKWKQAIFSLGAGFSAARLRNLLPAAKGYYVDSTARFSQSNFDGIIGVEGEIRQKIIGFLEMGPSIHRRSITITSTDSGLGDDYYAKTKGGYLWRIGAKYHMTYKDQKMICRAHYAELSGEKMNTGPLKYDHRELNLNAAQKTVGVDIGYVF
ncbi:MAG: hypothetical protein HQK54_09445 [Oligoflexales bacterium]|nr:hypothetical protein [Oligoflexales bacterium]